MNAERKRRHPRTQPDPRTTAVIDLMTDTEQFAPTLAALVVSESVSGCGVIVPASETLHVGARCRIQLGSLKPVMAEIRWRINLDPQAIKLGLMYLK